MRGKRVIQLQNARPFQDAFDQFDQVVVAINAGKTLAEYLAAVLWKSCSVKNSE